MYHSVGAVLCLVAIAIEGARVLALGDHMGGGRVGISAVARESPHSRRGGALSRAVPPARASAAAALACSRSPKYPPTIDACPIIVSPAAANISSPPVAVSPVELLLLLSLVYR